MKWSLLILYIVTNREIIPDEKGFAQLGSRPNAKGPNELRVVNISRSSSGRYRVQVLPDALDTAAAKQIIDRHHLPLDPGDTHYVSLKVAADITERARRNRTHVLFFVHGFNNNIEDVVQRAFALQDNFGIEVVPFTWPANGGGAPGVIAYKSDKRDARASTGALDRAMKIMHTHFQMLSESKRAELFEKAEAKHRNDPEARDALYVKLLQKHCPFTFNAMFHSMGNYLLKQMLKSSLCEGNELSFDNVILVAADTNNLGHAAWVDQIRYRNRLYIAINENDFALKASRAKLGSSQLARLGHYLRGLDSKQAHYINFTGAAWVKSSHAYFAEPAEKNQKVGEFFQKAFSGEVAEDSLHYRPEGNWFDL